MRGTGVGPMLVGPRRVGCRAGPSEVGPRGWVPGVRPQGDGKQGVAPEEGGGDTGVAPMALVPGGRHGVGRGDRDAGVGPRLLEGPRLVNPRGGLVGPRGRWRGWARERLPGGGPQEGGPQGGWPQVGGPRGERGPRGGP